MDYEDEEIILYRSPLGQYLEEVTDQDFGKYNPEPYSHITNDELSNRIEMEYIDWFKKQMITLRNYLSVKGNDKLDVIQSCKILSNSSFLCNEEQKLLIDLYDELQNIPNPVTTQLASESICTSSDFNYIIVLVLSICFALMCRCWQDVCAFILVVFSIYGLIYAKGKVVNVPQEILKNIKIFTNQFSQYDNLIDKVICHIKEVEVINHGYSHINTFNTTMCNSRGLSNGRKCLKLRGCLMDGLVDFFNQIRTNVRILLGNKRKDMQFDYKEEYIATMPAYMFYEILYPLSDQNKDGFNVVSLNQLKAVVCLYRSQMSEYVYEIIVSLFMLHKGGITDDYVKDILFSLEDLNKNIVNISKSVNEQFDISMKLIFQRKNITTEKRIKTGSTVDDTVHSAEIHLHTGLTRLEDIKSLFQQNVVPLNQPSLHMLNSLVSQFNLSIENAKSCLEDVVNKSQPIIVKDICITPDEHLNQTNITNENYVLFTKPFTDVGDMLYEGESNAVILKESSKLSNDDIETSLKKSRESRKLMRELKTILSAKESPSGLMSFPLTKVSEDQDSDTEYSCGNEVKIENIKEKKNYKSAYLYDPVDDDDVDCLDTETAPKIQQMGLPIGFTSKLTLKPSMSEEIYGSSDEDDNDNATGHDTCLS